MHELQVVWLVRLKLVLVVCAMLRCSCDERWWLSWCFCGGRYSAFVVVCSETNFACIEVSFHG